VSTAALAWRQFRFERRLFWRNPSAAFFNFLLPLLLLVLVASVFAGDPGELDVLVPGVAGMSVMATTFSALAFNLTFLREQGILKRVRGTPLPEGSYLSGLLGSAVVNAFAQVALVILIGHYGYGVELPQDPLLLAGFTALGVLARDPELRLGARLRQRRFPAADPDLGRLLLVRRSPGAPRRRGPGAAAHPPDRWPLGGDRRRVLGRVRADRCARRGRLGARRRGARRARVPLGVRR
jgi:hypothetical protein